MAHGTVTEMALNEKWSEHRFTHSADDAYSAFYYGNGNVVEICRLGRTDITGDETAQDRASSQVFPNACAAGGVIESLDVD
ncbi:hypothetical protein [Hoeflea sp. TYP-13]|uniref:hypothetical protein n=1 Tax=Hoeflea sp. TYP-13 TaxID=3230023 RepID=UPI0034C6D3BB